MRRQWRTGRLLSVITAPLVLAGALTALAPGSAYAAACQAWTGGQPPVPGTAQSRLDAVAVLTACDAWAVGFDSDGNGSRTLIEHWTGGSSWTAVPSPSPGSGINFLTGVRAVSATDIWAVGDYFTGSAEKTLILHWNGRSWLQVQSPSPGTFSELTGIRTVSAADAWAVGDYSTADGTQTLILHWDGTSWSQLPSPSPGGPDGSFLSGVAATSASDAWAVGDYLSSGQHNEVKTLILHWDGTSWKQASSPNPAPPEIGINQLTGVDATSPADAWAVGFFPDGTVDQTLILHWDGTAWTQVPSANAGDDERLDGVAATSAGNAWAVGTITLAKGLTSTLTVRWDGTAWTQVASPNLGGPGSENSLDGVAASSASDTWVVGMTGSPIKAAAFHLKCC